MALHPYSHDAMPISATELQLLQDACTNRDNQTAQSLLNVFGAQSAAEILSRVADAPVTIRVEMMDQVRKAVDEQRRFRPRR